jgi:hypothetical protein
LKLSHPEREAIEAREERDGTLAESQQAGTPLRNVIAVIRFLRFNECRTSSFMLISR